MNARTYRIIAVVICGVAAFLMISSGEVMAGAIWGATGAYLFAGLS